MTIEPMKPITRIDWEKVSHVRVTLEKPYKGGGLRFRLGTTAAKKNLNYNAHDPTSGAPYHPGVPIMYPEDMPAIAGNAERESFLMPAQDAYTAFGHFFAPLEVPARGTLGFTISQERQRVAAFWHWFKMPPAESHVKLNHIAPPDVPFVALRPLDRNFAPIKVEGEELVIRPRAFFDYDNADNYLGAPDPKVEETVALLQGFTPEEIASLRELVKGKRGKVAG